MKTIRRAGCSRLIIFTYLLIAMAITACQQPRDDNRESVANSDPLLAVGHGAFIAADGKQITPDAEFIRNAQQYYISTLRQALSSDDDEAYYDRTEKIVKSLVDDEILANALLVDWLLERSPEPDPHLVQHNNALRWHYVLEILQQSAPTDNKWTKGLEPRTAERLKEQGVPTTVLLSTKAGGREYVAECRDAGVPVPEQMYSGEWDNQGTFDKEFISEAETAELWLHESESPKGLCLALPRYPSGSNKAVLLGIICLGTDTNKACFFDNPRGKNFEKDVPVSIHEFVGGVDLVANGQGVCSDCHAGENPWVVHPQKPAFSGLPYLLPAGWPDPLVDASWPQNPGPTNLLDAVASTARCDSCHSLGSAGRFPDVSTELPGYCRTVLSTAVAESIGGSSPDASKRTMPPSFAGNKSQYMAHINALKDACGAPPSGGGVVVDVDIPDDTGFISPPVIIDPLYQCASMVGVRGAVLDAEVELHINSTLVGTVVPARSPTKIEFSTPVLQDGDQVRARQRQGGGPWSDWSPVITVRDHTVDYPAGIPTPEIDPTLMHQCGDIIAVRHIPGAKLTVFSNGGDPRSAGTSSDWTAIRPGKRPFDVGDTFTATASLCDDESALSAPQSAVAAPSSVPSPTLNPATSFAGQELVTIENITYGARVELAEASFGAIGDFTWPVSWLPDYDVATKMGAPLSTGDQLVVSQQLCPDGPTGKTELPPAQDCRELPAPKIKHPLVGQNFVIVTESVPGARVRVYDDSNDELGDGSGTVIMLKRALTGADILTVVQQVGECTSRTGYRISVRNPKTQDEPG